MIPPQVLADRSPAPRQVRRWISSLLALGLTAALVACGQDEATPPDSVQIRLVQSWIKNVSNASVWMAMDNGYFADQGLDVTVLPGGPNAPSTVVQVITGAAEIGQIDDLSQLLTAIEEGNDLVIIGAGLQRSPAGLLSLTARPVTNPDELETAKVLGGPAIEAWVKGALLVNGKSTDKFALVPAGFTPEPLVNGDGDAYSAFRTNQAITLETQFGLQEGRDWNFVTWEELGMPTYNQVYFARRDWLESNEEVAIGFLKALMLGWEAWSKDPKGAASIVVTEYAQESNLVLAQQELESSLTISFSENDYTDAHGLFWVDVERLSGPIYEGFDAAGFATPDNVEDFVDMSYQIAASEGEGR